MCAHRWNSRCIFQRNWKKEGFITSRTDIELFEEYWTKVITLKSLTIPNMQYSGKGKTIGKVKWSLSASRKVRGEDSIDEAQGIFKAAKP